MYLRSAFLATAVLLGALLAGCSGGDGPAAGDDVLREDHGPGFNYTAVDARGLPVPYPLCLPAPTSLEVQPGDEETSTVAPPGAAPSRCDFEMTPDEGRQGNEVTIAVDPSNPRNVVGGAKDYYPTDAGECVWDGIYVTHDGWRSEAQDRSFDGSPWRLLQEPTTFQPNYASQFWCTTDPVAYFDVHGTLYYLLMAYQADRVTGSDTCQDVCPQGALNDWAFNRATQIVAISGDGGDTFHTFTPVLEGSYPASFHDKGWIAVGADGTIHVMWLASFTPGNIYVRSTDGGQTYGDPEILATTLGTAGQGSFVDVGTGSQVYALWTEELDDGLRAVHLRRSMDSGATWDEDRTIVQAHDATMPGLSPRDRRGGFPAMATDRNPDSPLADALYVVWQDTCAGAHWSESCDGVDGSSIFFASSLDEGATWTTPLRIDGGADEAWKVFPAVSVSPGGVIDVSWMDTRGAREVECGGEAECSGTYPALGQVYTYSLDGGKTWSEPANVRGVDDGGWDPALSHHQNGMIFIGDYNDIDSSWQAAHPVWPDTRSGDHVDVYTATVQRPMFAEGWDAGKRAEAEEWIRAHPL